jgi:hypothetical protein
MQALLKKLTVVLGLFVFCATFVPRVSAECGSLNPPTKGALLHRQAWQYADEYPAASVVLASEQSSDDPIVGFWQVTFTARGNADIPDGTPIDKAYAQWHSDHTEIMNSSRPPVTSSFCLGVWKRVGHSRYSLNHLAISWDQNSNPVGPANIRENVALASDGKSFSGSFTIDQYDQSGNLLVHIQGDISASRISVDTPASAIF